MGSWTSVHLSRGLGTEDSVSPSRSEEMLPNQKDNNIEKTRPNAVPNEISPSTNYQHYGWDSKSGPT